MPDSIFQGFVTGLELRRQAEQQQLEREQMQQQHDLAQEQLKQQSKHYDALHDAATQQLDLEKQKNKADIATKSFALRNALNESYGTPGAIPMSQFPAPNTGQSMTPSGEVNTGIPQSSASTAQVENTPWAAGEAQGYGPQLQELFGKQMIDPNFLARQNAQLKNVTDIKAAPAIQEADIRARAEITGRYATANATKYAADVAAGSRRYAADAAKDSRIRAAEIAQGLNPDNPDSFGKYSIGVGNGSINPYKDLTKGAKNATLSTLTDSGYKFPDQTNDIPFIKNASKVLPIFDEMRNLANKYLSDTATGRAGTYVQGLLPGSDLKAEVARIQSLAPQLLGAQMSGIKGFRMTMPEIITQLNAMGTGKNSKAQVMQNIDMIEKNYYGRIMDSLSSYRPNQRVAILEANNPELLQSMQGKQMNYNGQVKDIFRYGKTDGMPHMFNTDTGKDYFKIDLNANPLLGTGPMIQSAPEEEGEQVAAPEQ